MFTIVIQGDSGQANAEILAIISAVCNRLAEQGFEPNYRVSDVKCSTGESHD
jgi:hypothetical protein